MQDIRTCINSIEFSNMKVILIFFLICCGLLCTAQSNSCDTLYLKNGKKINADVQNEYALTFSYILCCEECTDVKTIKKKDLKSIRFADSTVVNYDYEIPTNHPVTLGFELGGMGIIGGAFFELFPSDRIGMKFGIGYFYGTFPLHASLLLKFGKKRNFVPSLGIAKFYDIGSGIISNLTVISNFYGFQKNTKFGFIRLSPGLMVTMPDKDFQPWIGLSVGFNL